MVNTKSGNMYWEKENTVKKIYEIKTFDVLIKNNDFIINQFLLLGITSTLDHWYWKVCNHLIVQTWLIILRHSQLFACETATFASELSHYWSGHLEYL
jgi:hypothetical protein